MDLARKNIVVESGIRGVFFKFVPCLVHFSLGLGFF